MKGNNINNLNWNILKSVSNDGQDCFHFADVIERFPTTEKQYLSKVLSSMVQKGMLIKLRKDIYFIVPIDADASTYIPDWHIVAKELVRGKKYYIGYYSAMQIHGLITQPSLTEIIVTETQMKPSKLTIKGVEFQFVTHTKTRFFGFKNTWINKHDKVMVSNLEKTLVDALTKPHLCGGIVEIAKAIYETREKVNLELLIEYLLQNDSNAAIKRYLFLCDILGINWTSYHETIMDKLLSNYSLLDTSSPNEGKYNSKFGLKINMDIQTIKSAIFS
jgi:predicted transcriptional regulator of viral defense system